MYFAPEREEIFRSIAWYSMGLHAAEEIAINKTRTTLTAAKL